jgi:hypothetical protein
MLRLFTVAGLADTCLRLRVVARGAAAAVVAVALTGAPAGAQTPPMRSCAIPKDFRPGVFAFSLRASRNVSCSTASAVMKYWSRRALGPPDTFRLRGLRWRFASWRYNRQPSNATRQTLTFTAVGSRRVAFTTQPTN